MTDYTRSTGSSGTMLVRDTGTTIEFWINSNNSTTWSDHIPWSGTVNGVGVSGSFYYHPGSAWQRLGVWGVTTSQNVTFNLGNTGTSGFGGPTTLGPIFTNRTSAPAIPSIVTFSSATPTTVHVSFTDGANNGAAIDDRQFGYGTDNSYPQNFVHGGNSTTITGLTGGTKYYFWAQTHNSQGWSVWSPRAEITLPNVPAAPAAPTISNITQVSVVVNYVPEGTITTASYQAGYNTDPSAPTSFATTGEGVPKVTITGLSPGTKYYFWSRAQNIYGYGAWSSSTVAYTISGARIKVGAVWKEAIPYVKVSGVWKLARPWTRVAGTWKETI